MVHKEEGVHTSYMEIVMGDVSSALVIRRSVTESGKIMRGIGMDVFAISTGLEITSVLLFVRHLYQCIEDTTMIEESG
jgi:hypothetical protein